ncbi:hypothetical protein [Paracoccus sp. SCSIO 75233]|uniref:hypothetical protein n=1 Tax=Paracoccus sp. SCSIO 75233 TaxID=3017782 RepID=UPI0022F12D20|nr:hypothetical protein [Paracoccus sp. SCSIO 75233]WBU54184.1 hypothetical protein PAF12_04955 [Paracoccus sp. SCSIO 75233]
MQNNKRPGRLIATALALAVGVTPVAANNAPLSANDWLTGTAAAPGASSAWRPGDPVPADAQALRPVKRPPQSSAAKSDPPDVATTAATVPVGVRRLDAADADGTGIISARQAGLPRDFWKGTDLETALRMIRFEPLLPASADLARRVIEAQLPPPESNGEARPGDFFLARVDHLTEDGALPSAQALLQASGASDPESFQRLFDIAMLTDGEDRICHRMDAEPGITRMQAARIFCLAYSGDWSAAALLYRGAGRLGLIEPGMTDLLGFYLDDSATDGASSLPQPDFDNMTPLAFRLYEAVGQPLPTGDLPNAYAWSDLDDRSGWKAQLEAAERLSRAGVLPASTLHRLYTLQRPAASGGVWERAAAIQALDAALLTGDGDRIGPALQSAFHQMEAVGLRDGLAAMEAERLDLSVLTGDAARLALWLRLWEGETETPAVPENQLDAALLALASGGQPGPHSPVLGALAPVFSTELPNGAASGGGAIAPALFGALADADAGSQGDVTRAARGVATLRQLGLIADARRVATQIALDPIFRDVAK